MLYNPNCQKGKKLQSASTDRELLEKFDGEVWAKVPHFEGNKAVNSTPLVDVTEELLECAKTEYGLKLGAEGLRVFAKFDSKIHGGSVKVRPAASIIRDAISSGKLVKGQTI